MRTPSRSAVLACVGALLASLCVVLGTLGLNTSAAGAATYPPTTCATISVSTTTPRPGQTITVTGEQFRANTLITLTMTPYHITLARVTADGNGSFSAHVTMPLDARGHQLIHANGPGKICPADPIEITVTAPAGGGGGGGTAMTGVDVALLVGIALALLSAGVLFTRGGRRARSASASH